MRFTKEKEGIGGTFWLGGEPYQGPAIKVYALPDKYRLQHLHLEFGGEDGEGDFHVSVGLRYLYLFLGTQGFLPRSLRKRVWEWAKKNASPEWAAYQLDPFEGRETGVSFHDGSVWFKLWNNHDAWTRWDKDRAPWLTNGWTWSWSWQEFLFGEPMHEEIKVHTVNGDVVMPEGRYPAIVTQSKVRWCRRFGLGRKWLWRTEVEVEEGVPVPGKGTASYNQEDTTTTSISFPVQKERMPDWQACQKFAMRCLERRQKYGGLSFIPQKGWPDHMIPHH